MLAEPAAIRAGTLRALYDLHREELGADAVGHHVLGLLAHQDLLRLGVGIQAELQAALVAIAGGLLDGQLVAGRVVEGRLELRLGHQHDAVGGLVRAALFPRGPQLAVARVVRAELRLGVGVDLRLDVAEVLEDQGRLVLAVRGPLRPFRGLVVRAVQVGPGQRADRREDVSDALLDSHVG